MSAADEIRRNGPLRKKENGIRNKDTLLLSSDVLRRQLKICCMQMYEKNECVRHILFNF